MKPSEIEVSIPLTEDYLYPLPSLSFLLLASEIEPREKRRKEFLSDAKLAGDGGSSEVLRIFNSSSVERGEDEITVGSEALLALCINSLPCETRDEGFDK